MKYKAFLRVFDEMYYTIEKLAGKYPNEMIVLFRVERINEVLKELRGLSGRSLKPLRHDIFSDDEVKRLIPKGKTQKEHLLLVGWCDKIHPITHLFSATACAACAVAGRI